MSGPNSRCDTWMPPIRRGIESHSEPISRPMAELIKLRPVGEHRFRSIRDDGSLGEEVRFELAADGTPARVWRHSNYDERPAGD